MSAASSVTSSRRGRDRRTATAAGPPAPVTRTRVGERSGTETLRVRGGQGGGGRALGADDGAGLADHLERFAVLAGAAVAGPVTGGGEDEVVLQVGADTGLGSEAGQQPELGLGEAVDGDEPRRPEIHGRRRALETGERRHVAGGDARGLVDGAVVLVPIAGRVRVDDGGPDLRDHTLDDRDRRVHRADLRVLEVLEEEAGTDQLGGGQGLLLPVAGLAAPGAAGERQDDHLVAGRTVGGQGAADADLPLLPGRAA